MRVLNNKNNPQGPVRDTMFSRTEDARPIQTIQTSLIELC